VPEAADVTAIRGPLDADAVRRELRRRGSRWITLEVVSAVESTNAAGLAAARDGATQGLVLVAEEQTRGRGRLDRSWVSPRGAGLTLSLLLRPTPPVSTWGWLPLAAGVALATAVRALCDIDVALKWPNDLLLGPEQAKAAGILAESGNGAVVLGVGVNVSTVRDELPPGATSLRAQGAPVSREALLVELVHALDLRYAAWTQAHGDADRSGLLAAYQETCATLGRVVTVHLPQGEALYGTAVAVDPSGGLQVRMPNGRLTTVVAADVVHVRPGN